MRHKKRGLGEEVVHGGTAACTVLCFGTEQHNTIACVVMLCVLVFCSCTTNPPVDRGGTVGKDSTSTDRAESSKPASGEAADRQNSVADSKNIPIKVPSSSLGKVDPNFFWLSDFNKATDFKVGALYKQNGLSIIDKARGCEKFDTIQLSKISAGLGQYHERVVSKQFSDAVGDGNVRPWILGASDAVSAVLLVSNASQVGAGLTAGYSNPVATAELKAKAKKESESVNLLVASAYFTAELSPDASTCVMGNVCQLEKAMRPKEILDAVVYGSLLSLSFKTSSSEAGVSAGVKTGVVEGGISFMADKSSINLDYLRIGRRDRKSEYEKQDMVSLIKEKNFVALLERLGSDSRIGAIAVRTKPVICP